MKRHVLVAYATWTGSTSEVAEVVGQVLRESGLEVDVHPVTDVNTLHGYDALVLGSAIHAGKPLSEIMHFAERNKPALLSLPVAYFVVCATMMENTPEHRETVLGYLTPLRWIKEPVSMGLFAGAFQYKSVNLLLRLLAKLMHAPEGDWRNWDEIRAWAADLPSRLWQTTPGLTADHRAAQPPGNSGTGVTEREPVDALR